MRPKWCVCHVQRLGVADEHTHKTRHIWVCFVCVVGGGWHQNTKNTHRAHFSCFVMVGGGELPKHEEHTLIGVFFMVGRRR